MNHPQISVLAHDIRSAHNIGSIFRTCEGFGVEHLYLSGYTPYPRLERDTRLPHIVEKTSADIAKTALGAEESLSFSHVTSPYPTIDAFKDHRYTVIGLEQDPSALPLPELHAPEKILLILGEEVHGLSSDIIKNCDALIEIPMRGQKESFNVSVATGIALYGLLY